jgi:hypothetical protein
MARLQAIRTANVSVGAEERLRREQELRWAQERAFQEVREARGASDTAGAMHRAVQDLVDACERYIAEAMSYRKLV